MTGSNSEEDRHEVADSGAAGRLNSESGMRQEEATTQEGPPLHEGAPLRSRLAAASTAAGRTRGRSRCDEAGRRG